MPFIEGKRKGHNNANILEFGSFIKVFILNEFVGLASRNIFEFLGGAAGPFYRNAVNSVGLADAEGQRQFGLGEIAGAATNGAHLGLAVRMDANDGADGVAIGFGSGEAET